ncbi:hypothetical protein BH09ACT1_BH09ACT1_13610 [soil metagenome]
MMSDAATPDDAGVAALGVRELLDLTVARLVESGARDEALGTLNPGKGLLGLRTNAKMVPNGRAWRLGVLLLDRDGNLFATGSLTRAVVPGRVTNQNLAQEARKADRLAAARGKFDAGEVVNYRYTPIEVTAESLRGGAGVLLLVDGVTMVRWDRVGGTQALTALDAYLDERFDLLFAD